MSPKIRKILITGSSGTIGTRLFERLLERGYEVVGFDRKSNQWHQKLDKLTIQGNLLKQKDIKNLPIDFDLIVHLAANARVYDLVVKPNLALENIVSTFNILDFARKNKINRFIFSSSREVYSNQEKDILKETDFDLSLCESPYAASKIGDEALVCAFSKCYGLDYLIFRLSNVYGRYDLSDRFVPLVIRKMQKNQPLYIFGKDKLLDFTYIDDCTTGLIKGIEQFSKVKQNTLNLATGRGYKLTTVARLFKDSLQSKSKIIIEDSRPGEVVKFVADISKAKKLLGYKPEYPLEKGIKLTIDWYSKNNLNF